MELPPITGAAAEIAATSPLAAGAPAVGLRAAFGVALHMHQPTVLADGDPTRAALISNLQRMLEHPGEGDNHNAPAFLRCYARPAELVGGLLARGLHPRMMLDYSGNLLWGLANLDEARRTDVLPALRRTTEAPLAQAIEWLGTLWSHPVAPSTPVPDLELHMLAWRHHFGALFGPSALARVRGFSAPEMGLPIHPDACFAYVRALRRCGYQWLMVQEHTVESAADGTPLRQPRLPHRLVARSSEGEAASITVLVKTQGSDTKLVGQMQPFGEARSLDRQPLAGRQVPPYALQIGDGENGGVMMNEFPSAYEQAFVALGPSGQAGGVAAMNGSEYLAAVAALGVGEDDLPAVQPVGQHRIWREIDAPGPAAADQAIARLRGRDPSFNLDRASWTNDRSWVAGYADVMDPVLRLSASFHARWDAAGPAAADTPAYRRSLLYLLLSQTSCFRYWGHGYWTDVAQEVCRRGRESLEAAR